MENILINIFPDANREMNTILFIQIVNFTKNTCDTSTNKYFHNLLLISDC